MAEVGDIDLLLDKILVKGLQDLGEEKRMDVFTRLHKDLSNSAQKRCVELEVFKREPTLELMTKFSDSSKRWENFKRLSERHDKLNAIKCGDYQKEVLKPRNFLAHGKPEDKGDGSVRFVHNDVNYDFDEHIGTALRKTIVEYKNFFEEINDLLQVE